MNTSADETDAAVTETNASLIVECDLPDPPEKVWRALTEPELVARWLTADEEDTQQTRDAIEHPPEDAEHVHKGAESVPDHAEPAPEDPEHARDEVRRPPVECEVIEARPIRLVRYRWQDRDDDAMSVDSIVTFELSRTATGGTHLRLIHTPVQTATVMRLAA
jgi:uncharacterized protein YndB with AHSA1/START domain